MRKKTGTLMCRSLFFILYLYVVMSKSSVFIIATIATIALCGGCRVRQERPSVNSVYPKAKNVTRIVQYNVGVFSKEIENSIPMISSMMKEIGADAISLNELDSCNARHPNNQIKDFSEEMGGWNHKFGRAMPFRDGAYGVGVVVPDKIEDSFVIALPQGNGLEPRACAVVETKGYVLASTHLDYKDEPSIVVQAQTINKELAGKYSQTKKPVFLAGDMNSIPGSAVLNELAKRWDVISCRKNTFSAVNPHECIDFILVLRNGAKVEVVASDVPAEFETGEVGTASDHLPIFVDVKLR